MQREEEISTTRPFIGWECPGVRPRAVADGRGLRLRKRGSGGRHRCRRTGISRRRHDRRGHRRRPPRGRQRFPGGGRLRPVHAGGRLRPAPVRGGRGRPGRDLCRRPPRLPGRDPGLDRPRAAHGRRLVHSRGRRPGRRGGPRSRPTSERGSANGCHSSTTRSGTTWPSRGRRPENAPDPAPPNWRTSSAADVTSARSRWRATRRRTRRRLPAERVSRPARPTRPTGRGAQ